VNFESRVQCHQAKRTIYSQPLISLSACLLCIVIIVCNVYIVLYCICVCVFHTCDVPSSLGEVFSDACLMHCSYLLDWCCFWLESLCVLYGAQDLKSVLNTAKTTKLIQVPFGLWTRMDPRNHVLDGVQIPLGRGNFEGEKRQPIVKYMESLPWAVRKQLNRSRCHFGCGLGWVQESRHKMWVHIGVCEYDWGIHVWWWRSPLSNYFDYLFLLWFNTEIKMVTCRPWRVYYASVIVIHVAECVVSDVW